MVQCKLFTGPYAETDINTWLVDHPEHRYINHSHNAAIYHSSVTITVFLFYETNPHTVIRTGPNSVKSISHE